MIKKLILLLVLILVKLAQPALIRAQGASLSIWPPILTIMSQPGKTITQVYKIQNNGDPVILNSLILPFVASGENGNISLIDCQKVEVISCESLSWFSFQNANLALNQAFFLGSGKTQEVVLKISIPDYAAEGDYYHTLLFTTQASSAYEPNRSRTSLTIGSNILITISKDGNPVRTIKPIEFSAHQVFSFGFFRFSLPIFDSFAQIPVKLRVQNTGQAFTAVSGQISLTGFPGLKSLYQLPSQNILAGTTRLLTASPSGELNYNFHQNTLLLPKGFYLGRYRLTAKLENEEGEKEIKIFFYALPLKISFLFLCLTTAFMIYYFKIKKKS